MTKTEHEHRLAFTERQFEHFRLRAAQNQMYAQLALAKGDLKKAERELQAARNHLDFINECNETADMHRRAINPSEEDMRRSP